MEKIDTIYIRLLAIRLNYLLLEDEMPLINDIYRNFKKVISNNFDLLDEVHKYDNINLKLDIDLLLDDIYGLLDDTISMEKYSFLKDTDFINKLLRYIMSIKYREFGIFNANVGTKIQKILDDMDYIERCEKLRTTMKIINYE